jgi:fimbrial chaperone protein
MRGVLQAAAVSLLAAQTALAGNFSATPVRVALSPGVRTAVLTVENHADEELLLQTQLMAWSQQDGKDVLAESRDLLVSPPIVRIPAGGAQTLRVGLMRPADSSRQLTYRLFLQEVPARPKTGQEGVGVSLRFSLPVFVAPVAAVVPQLRWDIKPATEGAIALTLNNAGNAHTQLLDLKLALPDGTVLVEEKPAAYVLAGQSRTWTFKTAQPWNGEALKLTAKTDAGPASADIPAAGK